MGITTPNEKLKREFKSTLDEIGLSPEVFQILEANFRSLMTSAEVGYQYEDEAAPEYASTKSIAKTRDFIRNWERQRRGKEFGFDAIVVLEIEAKERLRNAYNEVVFALMALYQLRPEIFNESAQRKILKDIHEPMKKALRYKEDRLNEAFVQFDSKKHGSATFAYDRFDYFNCYVGIAKGVFLPVISELNEHGRNGDAFWGFLKAKLRMEHGLVAEYEDLFEQRALSKRVSSNPKFYEQLSSTAERHVAPLLKELLRENESLSDHYLRRRSG